MLYPNTSYTKHRNHDTLRWNSHFLLSSGEQVLADLSREIGNRALLIAGQEPLAHVGHIEVIPKPAEDSIEFSVGLNAANEAVAVTEASRLAVSAMCKLGINLQEVILEGGTLASESQLAADSAGGHQANSRGAAYKLAESHHHLFYRIAGDEMIDRALAQPAIAA